MQSDEPRYCSSQIPVYNRGFASSIFFPHINKTLGAGCHQPCPVVLPAQSEIRGYEKTLREGGGPAQPKGGSNHVLVLRTSNTGGHDTYSRVFLPFFNYCFASLTSSIFFFFFKQCKCYCKSFLFLWQVPAMSFLTVKSPKSFKITSDSQRHAGRTGDS